MPALTIRPEAAGDEPAVHDVLTAAFDGPDEAALVDALRRRDDTFTLVAEVGGIDGGKGTVVGAITFSPVAGRDSSAPPDETGLRAIGLRAIGLAPMAVRPDRQRQGIGSALVRAGLDACRARGIGLVVVLGHPGYYPRFGFRPAAAIGLRCRWSHDEESFMYLELQPGQARLAGGFVEYCAEFDRF